MKRSLLFVTTLIIMLVSGATFAQCHLDGRIYEEGAIVAGYVCSEGRWVAM